MTELNEVIIKSIFKKLKVECLILQQTDNVEYDNDCDGDNGENYFVESELEENYLCINKDKINNLDLNLESKDYLPEKVYNFAIAQSFTNPILLEVFSKKAIDYVRDFWQNNKPTSNSNNWLIDVNEETNSVGWHKTSHWIFIFIENDEIKIKLCHKNEKESFKNWFNQKEKFEISEEDIINNPAWKTICN